MDIHFKIKWPQHWQMQWLGNSNIPFFKSWWWTKHWVEKLNKKISHINYAFYFFPICLFLKVVNFLKSICLISLSSSLSSPPSLSPVLTVENAEAWLEMKESFSSNLSSLSITEEYFLDTTRSLSRLCPLSENIPESCCPSSCSLATPAILEQSAGGGAGAGPPCSLCNQNIK